MVAILGAGGVGKAYATWLAGRGHDVRIWTPSGKSTAPLRASGTLVASGLLTGTWPVAIASDLAEAVSGAEVIILAIPVNAHRAIMDALASIVGETQAVLLSAPIGLSSLYLKGRLETAGKRNTLISIPVPALNGRMPGPGEIYISGKRPQLDIAVWPEGRDAVATAICQELFGFDVVSIGPLLVAELANINAVAHAGNALCNLTRMERGETWFTYAGVTPRVAALIEAADAERIAIGAALGLTLKSFTGYLREWYGIDDADLASLTARIAARPNPTPAPKTDMSRYVTEDIPFGIMTLRRLGEALGVKVPTLHALEVVFDTLYSRNLSSEVLFEEEVQGVAGARLRQLAPAITGTAALS